MLAAVKTPLIDLKISIQGKGEKVLIEALKSTFKNVRIIKEDVDFIDFSKTRLYKDIKNKTTVGDVLSIRRENKGWTQKELSIKSGVSNISAIEHNKRSITLKMAKKLGKALGQNYNQFLEV